MGSHLSVNGSWTTYEPPEHEGHTQLLSGILEGYTEDCRRFAHLARTAQLDALHHKFGLSWEDFCVTRLHTSPEVVEAIVIGVEVLGEEMPIPLEVAKRVGRKVLCTQAKPKPGPKDNSTNLVELSQPERAQRNGVSRAQQQKLDYLAGHAPDLLESVQAKTMSTHRAYNLARGVQPATPLDVLRKVWPKVSAPDRLQFLSEVLTEAERHFLLTGELPPMEDPHA